MLFMHLQVRVQQQLLREAAQVQDLFSFRRLVGARSLLPRSAPWRTAAVLPQTLHMAAVVVARALVQVRVRAMAQIVAVDPFRRLCGHVRCVGLGIQHTL